MQSQLEHLFLSAGHNFFGHHGRPAGQHSAVEVAEVACVAGRGIVGDRFFDYRRDYSGQITFFALEVFEALKQTFDLPHAHPSATRRNVLVRGVELPDLIYREFCVQGIWFRGAAECKPCYWMDGALAPGTEAWLRGKGGLRARILTDGTLRLGPAELRVAGQAEFELSG